MAKRLCLSYNSIMSKRPKGEPREFPGQHPGEQVQEVFNQHPIVLRWPLIWGMLAILFGLGPLLLFPLSNLALEIALIVPVISFCYWFYKWLNWHYSVNIITNQRLIVINQKGLFNRKVKEVGFEKVQSINYHIKGIQAALLKYGDITLETYTGDWLLKDIYHPEEIHSVMMDMTHQISQASSTPMER